MAIERGNIRWNGWGWMAHQDALAGREEVWSWLARELGMPALLATPSRAIDEIPLPDPGLDAEFLAGLTGALGADRIRTDRQDRITHAVGRSYHDLLRLRSGELSAFPDAVVYPRGQNEVAILLELAARFDTAVIPYGGGTSVVGGVTAARGPFRTALSLDLSGMDRVIGIDAASLTATAEPGIFGPALEDVLQAKGLTLGHYPQSFEFSTLGGWIAHNGAGQGSNRYGRPIDWLVGAKVVTPRGVIDTNTFPSSSTGPDLKYLLIGSEGTFGIITEATIRVRRLPQASVYVGYLFPDFESGTSAIRRAVQMEIPTTMMRLSDKEETRFYRALGDHGGITDLKSRITDMFLRSRGLGDGATALIAGFEGDAGAVHAARKEFHRIARNLGALSLGEGPGRRWLRGRFLGPYLRDPMMDRGIGVDTLETATSWSNLGKLYAAVRRALDDAMRQHAPHPDGRGVVLCHVSHSYPDGASLYFTYIFPRALGAEIAQWNALKQAATQTIVSTGGTISHHHGVGEDHRPWISGEKGALGIEVLRAVKHTLDPKGILNPGKLIPE